MSEVTRILDRLQGDDPQAAEELLPLVYGELRKLAATKFANEPPGQTLQPTALVHEAWLRLVGAGDSHWNSRGHFFGAAAEAMRRILVENARRKRAQRHGGDQERIELETMELPAAADEDRLLAIHDALDELSRLDVRQAEVVKLRFFVGLNLDEIAALHGVSEKTIRRQWTHAKVWLFERLRPET